MMSSALSGCKRLRFLEITEPERENTRSQLASVGRAMKATCAQSKIGLSTFVAACRSVIPDFPFINAVHHLSGSFSNDVHIRLSSSLSRAAMVSRTAAKSVIFPATVNDVERTPMRALIAVSLGLREGGQRGESEAVSKQSQVWRLHSRNHLTADTVILDPLESPCMNALEQILS
jgi:hypothetical protein